ncbi:hypothetical protein MKW98_006668 [Papaver atlanticum]|uniref:Pollen Ole e 1 allergen and extensin family protein n=1 Tax=Papaver atlanticum TaxID=357466 RepID=A0AAD4T2N1_9MAGN|nr:hypothetical protein MKW98_006668 [Papaver atlanticum]
MKIAIAVVATLLLACIKLGEASYDEQNEIHVGGKVLCQDCSGNWNEWVRGGKPIKGCKVSVTCMDESYRPIYYASHLTDEQGEFEMIINKKNKRGKELKNDECKVRLVSSPDKACSVMTDFAGGKSGVRLTHPSAMFRNTIRYTLGPFYFTTPMCVEPADNTYPSASDEGYGRPKY